MPIHAKSDEIIGERFAKQESVGENTKICIKENQVKAEYSA